MTAPQVGNARMGRQSTVRSGVRTRRAPGAAPLARPILLGPVAAPARGHSVRRSGATSSCRVVSPAARRQGLLLKLKVAAVAVLTLVGVGVSAAEFASWSHVDPAIEYVAGDPAWAHVESR